MYRWQYPALWWVHLFRAIIMLSSYLFYAFAASGVAFAAPALQQRQAASWPALNAIPSTDSDLARQWISQIDFNSVPQIPTTSGATCDAASNPLQVEQAAANCWWTCNTCVREADISICPTKGDWGLTFDDGPTPQTVELLDDLLTDNTKATFFIIGSQAAQFPDIVRRIVNEGHQIAVHTWSHNALTSITNEQIVVELGWTREVLSQIVGGNADITLMRPPFGDIDDRVRSISQQMGLTPTMWSQGFDTNDWRLGNGPQEQPALETAFEELLTRGQQLDTGFITLQHDSGSPTVRFAIDVILPRARRDGWNLRSLAQCGAV